jgi:hypothetical protein
LVVIWTIFIQSKKVLIVIPPASTEKKGGTKVKEMTIKVIDYIGG